MVIITGFQRSSTSFLASCFQASGYDLGSELWHRDINGGLENEFLMNWAQKKIKHFPFSDYTPTKCVKKNFEQLLVVKCTFVFMVPALLQMFIEEFGYLHFRFLIMQRAAEDIVKSKESHKRFKKHDHLLLKQNGDQIEANFAKSVEIITRSDSEAFIVPFETILTLRHEIEKFTELKVAAQIEKHYQTKKIEQWKK